MASNILSLPFRKTHQLSFTPAVTQYISSKYDQHPEMFRKDLEAIDRLRNDAIHVHEPHASGIIKIQTYAAHLEWIGGKFPIDIGVDFTWYPALGYHTDRPDSQNNLRFEIANILYNLGALYSQLAVSVNRSTGDGLKSACNYFSLASGIMLHLRKSIIPELRSTPPEDMDEMTLESLEYLLLAQAQECFWQKAVMLNFKDLTIAKLAARVCDLYGDAGDCGIKSDAISTEWLHHMNAKHHHFAAAAQFRASIDCLGRREYGEEVARLRGSLRCIDEALPEAKWCNKMVLADSQGLKVKVQEELKRAEKDIDMIYLGIPIPDKSELKKVERKSMTVSTIPKEVSEASSMIGENGQFGKPLFSKLVSFAVHAAETVYVNRRDQLTKTQVLDELESLTGKIHDVLQSLNLPGSLQALERPLGIPPGLISHAEEIRQEDGLNSFYRSLEATANLRKSDEAIFYEGVEVLESEREEDERARAKYGTDRWNRPPSSEAASALYTQVGEIEGYLKMANDGDQQVRAKLADCESLLKLLSGPDRDLENFVPSSRRAVMTPRVEREVGKLRATLNEVSRLENRRKRKIELLKEKVKRDDISNVILGEAARLERDYPHQKMEAAQFEPFFARRLQRYDDDIAAIRAETEEQEALLQRLETDQSSFQSARKGDTSAATREREKALQQLEGAYLKYKEIATHLDSGRKFYNDLGKMAAKFRDQCKNFAYQRRLDASHLESDVSTPLAAMSLNAPTAAHSSRPSSSVPHRAPSNNESPPLVAPVPTRVNSGGGPQVSSPPAPGTWNPQMGIKFGFPPPEGSGMMQAQQQGVGGPPLPPQQPRTWDPSSGLRFG